MPQYSKEFELSESLRQADSKELFLMNCVDLMHILLFGIRTFLQAELLTFEDISPLSTELLPNKSK